MLSNIKNGTHGLLFFLANVPKDEMSSALQNVYIGGNEGLYMNIMNHMITSLRKEKG